MLAAPGSSLLMTATHSQAAHVGQRPATSAIAAETAVEKHSGDLPSDAWRSRAKAWLQTHARRNRSMRLENDVGNHPAAHALPGVIRPETQTVVKSDSWNLSSRRAQVSDASESETGEKNSNLNMSSRQRHGLSEESWSVSTTKKRDVNGLENLPGNMWAIVLHQMRRRLCRACNCPG